MLEGLTELRETLKFTSLSKDTINDTDEQPGEVIHRMRPENVLSRGVSVPVESRSVTLLVYGSLHKSESSLPPTN